MNTLSTTTKTKTFPKGGVHPKEFKFSAKNSIESIPLPKNVFVPLTQHLGARAKPVVNPGDKVKVGQLIAEADGFVSANIHSPVSGTVKNIDEVIDQTGYKQRAVIIETEGDEWLADIELSKNIKRDCNLSTQEISDKIFKAGIVGLGGATFPTHVKLKIPPGKKLEHLIINGVECEPFLTSDHRLMLEKGEEIIIGIKILMKVLNTDKAIIGIEVNKPDAINNLSDIASKYPGIEIHPLKVHYPQGGERQLVRAITGKEVPPPPSGLPIDVGCIIINVGTAFAVYEAVQKNKPLVERVVTVTGKSLKKPSNFLVRLGTTISHIISVCGGLPSDTGKIISGGPMMGKALASLDIPVTKGTSGIVIIPENEAKREEVSNCIRCGRCVEYCPLGLEPYLYMTLVERNMIDKAEEVKIHYCCECGCCSYTCPANRPLTDYIRLGKNIVLYNIKKRQTKKDG
ncbi:MAG: electron transport complex subunit RsxC [Candidatus Omnitrophica bacterium]|nr:electron transport complex subunit RsxC [Candidatus Omnitrophota bacterium]